jgi:ribosomal protein L7/L12
MKNFESYNLNQMVTCHSAIKKSFPTVASLLEAAIKEANQLYFQDVVVLTELEKIWLEQGERFKVLLSIKARTGWTLLEARVFVDEYDSGSTVIDPKDQDLSGSEKASIKRGDKLSAIKALRDRTGISVLDAKHIVDGWKDDI